MNIAVAVAVRMRMPWEPVETAADDDADEQELTRLVENMSLFKLNSLSLSSYFVQRVKREVITYSL